jgi:hypothetical protein
MTRRPPTILSVSSTAAHGIEAKWEVDTFFPDSAQPEKVLIDLNGSLFAELDGDEDSVEIPNATLSALGTPSVTISVSFWWSGPPAEEQQSSVSVPIDVGGGAHGGVVPAAKPIVTLLQVLPRTAQAKSSISIGWKSNNYNDGNIVWGRADAPTAFQRSIKPVGTKYDGVFTTDQKLASATLYAFKVAVRNTLQSPNWISTTIMVRSAADTLSLRAFLLASGRPINTGLATVVGAAKSLHRLLVG